jgi:hypothetical protein
MDLTDQELIQVKRGVTLKEAHDLILNGEMMLPSVQTFYMGINYLKIHI